MIACYFPSCDFQLLDVCAQLTPKNDFWSCTLRQEIISPVRKWKERAEAWNHEIKEIIYSNAQYCKGNRIRIELGLHLNANFAPLFFYLYMNWKAETFVIYILLSIFFFLTEQKKGVYFKKRIGLMIFSRKCN